VFSCGWHITRDGLDVYSLKLRALVKFGGGLVQEAPAIVGCQTPSALAYATSRIPVAHPD
jgi:hypothetical protein